jgi:AcrR family transcriptional regulator
MRAVELVVRESGIEGATVRAIAARAGVSVGTVYRRFANKRALVTAVRDRFLAQREERAVAMLRRARRDRGRESSARPLTGFVSRALVSIERDRPLLRAFANAASSDRRIHAELTALIGTLATRPVDAGLAVDVLLTALRGLAADASLPSGQATQGRILGDCLARSFQPFLVARPVRGGYSSPP